MRVTVGIAAALVLAGCASAGHAACVADADCASGRCLATGACAAVGSTGATDAGADSGEPRADGGTSAPDGGVSGGTDGGAVDACSAAGAARIERKAVPLEAGASAPFEIASDATVNEAGTTGASGREWDLSQPLAGDQRVTVSTLAVAGRWFAADFPDATYAAQLAQSSTNLGVFEVTDAALLLLGVVSPDGGLGQTELKYAPPVPVLQFPLTVGAAWSVTSVASGTYLGVFASATDSYDTTVDALGVMATPYGRFPVQRVRTVLSHAVGLLPATTTRTDAYVAPCFGVVATVTSQSGEAQADFTVAAEARRLTK